MTQLKIDNYIQLVDILNDWILHDYEYSKEEKPKVLELLSMIETIVSELKSGAIKTEKITEKEIELDELRHTNSTANIWQNKNDIIQFPVIMRTRTYKNIKKWLNSKECPYYSVDTFATVAFLYEINRIKSQGFFFNSKNEEDENGKEEN